jgi:hypothetical protein
MAKKWTVMVYMAAQDNPDLDQHAIRDIREMERVGSNPHLDVVVQVSRPWPSLPQRYRVGHGKSELAADGMSGDSMGNPNTLWGFLDWVLDRHPAEHYFLVLWGHAYGLGFGRDHHDALRLKELKAALFAFRTRRFAERPALDLLGANACAMSYAEAAFELRHEAQYLVASQIAVPFVGWPYESILRRITPTTDPSTLGRIVVDSYVNQFAASPHDDHVAMSLLNLAKADELGQRVTGLARSLTATIQQADAVGSDRRTHIRTAFLTTAAGDVRPLIDLRGLGQELVMLCKDLDTMEVGVPARPDDPVRQLQKAASELEDFLIPAVEQVGLLPPTTGPRDEKASLVMLHKRHADLEGLNGIGIFAPFVTDDYALARLELLDSQTIERGPDGEIVHCGRATYQALDLMDKSDWPGLVYDELREEMPEEVIASMDSSGATSRAEMAAVSQMLVSIDSAFNKLDRAVASAKATFDQLPVVKVAAVGSSSVRRGTDLSGFEKLELLRPADLDEILQKLAAAQPPKLPPTHAPTQASASAAGAPVRSPTSPIESLESIEHSLGRLERAARRTLTHDTFGLGPGSGFEVKPRMGLVNKPGLGEVKPRMGELKPRMGEVKPRMGDLVPGLTVVGLDAQTAAVTLIELFALVAESFRDLETAVETVERTAAEVAAGVARNGTGKARLDRAFRIAADASADARLSLRQVLAHPLYGIGPGSRDFGADDRRQLARIGGLHSGALRLL